ncbi:MAG: phosphonate metabolism transcriptional regulator PhnF [Methyloprofundus sp.]|nr:phosphonate metabolism transcriptional regulator PhnF [Methyloprofundus sp.]
MLDRKQGKPIYQQIADNLQSEITQYYHSGDILPSEQELAKRFSVNRHTLRRGVDELIGLGLVDRVHGKGTLVLDAPVEYSISKNSRFSQNLEALGKSSDSKLLRKIEIKAHGNIAKLLEISKGDAVLWLETLRKVDDKPFCLISHYLPLARLGESIRDYESGSLHTFLKGMSLKPVRMSSIVSACLPINEDGLLLSMPRHLPVLRVKTVNIDAVAQKPIEYSLARFRSDRAQLSIDIL